MERYLMYLRKSRMDTDYENVSVAETLSRHRTILEEFCKLKRLNVVEVLEEVVSGESMHARPEMMRLLDLISTGMYAGVVCMDIERLSRGSSMDSGYIMQVLQVNNCKIITPGKTYDLRNDSDEQFTDMKFMFSRYELKSINTRLERGRNQSASEGKFMGSMAPYGYRPFNLAGEKGNSLRIEPEEAKVVQMIFEMYGQQGMGYNAIAYKLNDLHIPARKGEWSQTSVVNILNNEVYLGKIRWRREPVKKVIKDGKITKKRIQNQNYDLYEGRHDAIITQEQWDCVKAAQERRGHHSTHTSKELQNTFVGILYCEKCGARLKRNVPGKNQGTAPWFRCPTRHCDCRSIKCHILEDAVWNAMDDWLDEYIIQLDAKEKPEIDPIIEELEIIQDQLAGLLHQQDTICGYLEKGIYTIEMFQKRNASLSKEIARLQETEEKLLRKRESGEQANQAALDIIPTTQHILDNYDALTTEEKNRLWKLVLRKVTAYRTPDGKLSVHIYPKLPKAI